MNRKKKIIIGSSVAVGLILIVIVSIYATRKDLPEVTTTKVEKVAELRAIVTASGEVRPVKFIKLTSEVAGRVEEIFVKEGDVVKTGQPLVRLDPTQLEASKDAQAAAFQAAVNDAQSTRSQLVSAENNVAQSQQTLVQQEAALAQARQLVVVAQSDIDKAQVDLTKAERELKRTSDLTESGVSSRADYDAANDTLQQGKVALRQAQERFQQQRVAVDEATARVNQQRLAFKDAENGVVRARTSLSASESRANQQQATLRGQVDQRDKALQHSPIDGVVADLPTRQGEFALANFSSTPLMTIADMSTINVEINVDETEIANVEIGQPARIKVDAFGEREIGGVVTQKNPLAINKSDTTGIGLTNRINVQEAKEFLVVIELRNLTDDIRSGLRPGMSSTATITTKVRKDVVIVPLQAIVEKPATPAGSPGASPSPSPRVISGEKPKDLKGVYVINNNKVKFVEVATGIVGESDIEVTSGVKAGDEIVTGPNQVLKTLRDGTAIKRRPRTQGSSADSTKNI
ncbi:MAG: HlyD family secretion protein [Pyrinomonadaceae bacterium]